MTDEGIQKAWRDIGGADGRMILPLYEFARAISAQARAELIAELRAVAWMRVHTTPSTPASPAEHDIDIHIGEDMPDDGRDWTPLAIIPNQERI